MAPSHFDLLPNELDGPPSPNASISSENRQLSPTFDLPSQHSGFRSVGEESESESNTDSVGPWSPPAWRRPGHGWFQKDRLETIHSSGSPSRSRETSPEFFDRDATLPANVPLPKSPEKRDSPPPLQPAISIEQQLTGSAQGGWRDGTPARAPESVAAQPQQETVAPNTTNNYIKFAMRAEMQHSTDNIDALIVFLRYQYRRITGSKTSLLTFISTIVLFISIMRSLVHPQDVGPGPDLIKAAGVAKNFERLIYYSESGVAQVGDLQETGVAVWDLGESVRSSNMTSAPIIVRQLDDLSESLKTLAIELTKFFSNVDGDVDSILIVMEWAKRELSQVSSQVPGPMDSVYDNALAYAHKIGGDKVGNTMTQLFGSTRNQITKATLQRTFNEFLNVLEDSINSELTYTTVLFRLFESVDRQFLNLQRTVIRELDSQDAKELRKSAELAELWRRMLGSNISRIHKFEKNRDLLASIKDRTVQNKLALTDHNRKLLDLKSKLEDIRKRLVSPLVRSNDSSTLSVERQIEGLDGVYEHLRGVREEQKSKMMQRLYDSNNQRRRASIAGEIEGP